MSRPVSLPGRDGDVHSHLHTPSPPLSRADSLSPRLPLVTSARPSSSRVSPAFSRQTQRLRLRQARFQATPLFSTEDGTDPLSPSVEPIPLIFADGEGETEAAEQPALETVRRHSSATFATLGHDHDQENAVHRTLRRRDPDATPEVAYSSPAPDETMRLREGSTNPRAPSLKRPKTRPKRWGSVSSPDSEAAQYIEHIEAQLTMLQSQIKLLTSPTNATSQASKLRAAVTEARHLRLDVADWEARFEQRVQEGIAARAVTEAGLRTSIRNLERECEIVAAEASDLGCQLEEMEKKVATTDALEAENAALEKRVDLLTKLLAHSPTDPASQPELSSTGDLRRQRSRRRPRSMIACVASPEEAPRSVPSMETPKSHKRRSLQSTSTHSASSSICEACPADFPRSPLASASRSPLVDGTRDLEPASMPRTPSSPLAPDASSAWGSPPAPSSAPPRRTMRRFRAGSSGPRPLILPIAAQSTGFQTSPSVGTGPSEPSEPTMLRLRSTASPDPSGVESSTDSSVLHPSLSSFAESDTRRAPRSLFAELKARHQQLSSSATTGSSLDADVASVVDGSSAVSRRGLRTRPDVWFGLASHHRPPPFALTGHAQWLETWRDPIRLVWRVVVALWSPRTTVRMLAGLSWCLLGLVLGPGTGSAERPRRLGPPQPHQGAGGRDEDGAVLSRSVMVSRELIPAPSPTSEAAVKPSRSPGAGSPLRVAWSWLRFSVALVLAVGVAVREGPDSLFARGREEGGAEAVEVDGAEEMEEGEDEGEDEKDEGDGPDQRRLIGAPEPAPRATGGIWGVGLWRSFF
ncbi:MAG: hypothetical protein M1838_003282 [Thelocarpon superellum]|nr:MAG: hypothetical protein M1838_003282 [Thelocarpon superellum]